MMHRSLLATLAAYALLALAACSSGNAENCPGDYGFVLSGACDETGNSRDDCPAGASCNCDGATNTSYICFDGQCVTEITNCDAWCAASNDEQQSCF